MNVVIYGAGKCFYNYFINSDFCLNCFLEDEIKIVGIVDGSASLVEKKIELKSGRYSILGKNDILSIDFDYIFVSSMKYYYCILNDLVELGVSNIKIRTVADYIEEKMNDFLQINRVRGQNGIEIGGPSAVFNRIYSVCNSCDDVDFSINTVWRNDISGKYSIGNEVIGNTFISDATDLKLITSESYDFVLSSNNIEHMANPIKALKEFLRILKPGGIMYIVVPYKEMCFDHNREYTSYEHIIEDFEKDVSEFDLTHLPEIIAKHDYSMDVACESKEKFIERSKSNYENRCLHHHVFSIEVLEEIAVFLRTRIIYLKRIENNLYLITEKMMNV